MKRIQRKRIKGWKMPPNTVYIGRPSIYGNPFSVKEYGREGAIDKYFEYCCENPGYVEMLKDNLQGKDIACWCREDRPCHGDIILHFINKP